MDPDSTHAELRATARELLSAYADTDDISPFEDEMRVMQLFLDLDNWISTGGYLPKDWRNA